MCVDAGQRRQEVVPLDHAFHPFLVANWSAFSGCSNRCCTPLLGTGQCELLVRGHASVHHPVPLLPTVLACGTLCVPPLPSADSSQGIRAAFASLSQCPWHAPSRGTGEASRGTLSSRPCRDAGCIQHAPTVDGGLCCRVPTRPERPTPPIRFVSLAPHVRSTLPSDAPSRERLCASLVLRLHAHLDRGLSPPSMTACTAHTLCC
jgi:hypothetical protein